MLLLRVAALITLAVVTTGSQITPLTLHFEKEYQLRNFFNLKVVLKQFDPSKDIGEYLQTDITSNTCSFRRESGELVIENQSGSSTAESYLGIGKVHNYAAIDIDIASQDGDVILALVHNDKTNRIVIKQTKNGALYIDILKAGCLSFSESYV